MYHASASEKDAGEEVSWCAHQHLSEALEIAPGAELLDLLRLLGSDPVLRSIYKNQSAREIWTAMREYLKSQFEGHSATESGVAPEDLPDFEEDAFEYLELRADWRFNTHSNRYYGFDNFVLTGVCNPSNDLATQLEITGMASLISPEDQMMRQSVGLVDLVDLLHLPITVSTTVEISEGDPAAKSYLTAMGQVNTPNMTLAQVLYGVLAELSFYGPPREMEQYRDALFDRMDATDLDTLASIMPDGTATLVPPEAIAPLMNLFQMHVTPAVVTLDKVFAVLQIPVPVLNDYLSKMEDHVLPRMALAAAFGNMVALKPAYEDYNARELRRAILQGSDSAAPESAAK